MTHQNAKLDALVARIRAEVEIRKTKSGKATIETAKTRAKREARERGDDPALRALMRASNATQYVQKLDPYRHFHEVAKTVVLQKQICRCCGETQVNVVSEMVHLRGRVAPDTPIGDVWIRRSSVAPLPHEDPIWAPAHSVEFCAPCIEAAAVTSCWSTSKQNIEEGSGQLPLIH